MTSGHREEAGIDGALQRYVDLHVQPGRVVLVHEGLQRFSRDRAGASGKAFDGIDDDPDRLWKIILVCDNR